MKSETVFENEFFSDMESKAGVVPSDLAAYPSRISRAVTIITVTAAMVFPQQQFRVPSALRMISLEATISQGTQSTLQPRDISASEPQRNAWENYLDELQKPAGRFARNQIDGIRQVWSYVKKLNEMIFPPQAAPTEESAIEMVWDNGSHHVEIDVFPDRRVEWFYSNRDTGHFEGDDQASVGSLPTQLAVFIRLLA